MKFIRVLVRKETSKGRTMFVAQGLDRDIAVQENTVERLRESFVAVLKRMIEIAKQRGEEPLARIKPAPAMYWRQWGELTGQRPVKARKRITASQPDPRPVLLCCA